MTVAAPASERALASDATRWGQLIFGIICMVMIANLQYGWTLFVNPIDQKYHWGRAAIQVAFTIFVLTETWLVPIEGYLIDKFGPKAMNIVFSRPIWSDTQPKNGRHTPLSTLSMVKAKVSAGNVNPRIETGTPAIL